MGLRPRPLVGAALGLALWQAGAAVAAAHQPLIEPGDARHQTVATLRLEEAVPLGDPTRASVAAYGALSEPDEVDVYRFTAGAAARIPVEVLVPVRPSNRAFRPGVVIVGPGVGAPEGPLGTLPPGLSQLVVAPPEEAERPVFFEPFSLERLYRGREATLAVEPGATYHLVVYEGGHRTGDYALGVGVAEDFGGVSLGTTIRRVAAIKLGLVGGRRVPVLDLVGLLLFLAGFVVGLGAVTVIDVHGFLGRKSAYWTEATTRTHKVTKPLIWAGIATASLGAAVYYRDSGLSGAAAFQAALALLLVANGIFLTFRVSPFLLRREREGRAGELLPPRWQAKIAVSFVVSIIGWWGSLFLLAWQVLVLR